MAPKINFQRIQDVLYNVVSMVIDPERLPSKKRIKYLLRQLNPKILIPYLIYTYWTYFRYNMKEIRKRKLSYCLGCMSCFVVVVAVSISITALNQIPIVFLRLAENSNGQFDFRMKESSMFGVSLNYTMIKENIRRGAGEKLYKSRYRYSAPRTFFSGAIYSGKSCTHSGQQLSTAVNETDWMYNGFSNPDCKKDQQCAEEYCSSRSDAAIYSFDTELENDMGFGRSWDEDRPRQGEVIINQKLSDRLGVGKGDTVILKLDTSGKWNGVWQRGGVIPDHATKPSKYYLTMYVPFTIAKVTTISNAGKADFSGEQVYVDFESMLRHVGPYARAQYRTSSMLKTFQETPHEQFAEYVYFNMPDRIQEYNHNDYEDIQQRAISFASGAIYFIGFNQIETEFPILVYLRTSRFFALFLGLIVNIIVTVLTILSIILIYSLLMINVENRTFEIGVLRMIGMNKWGVLQTIVMQAFIYAIPGLIFGLIVGELMFLGLSFGLVYIFEANLPYFLSGQAILMSFVVGLVIPILSSLFPIRRALGQNLTESLDMNRSKTKAVKYNIERASDSRISWTQIAFGLACAVFGFGVYYMFPLGLLNGNITILLYMFFGVLLGMLLGLVMLALNFENILESILSFAFLWWENAGIRSLMLKNLIAHRLRNRKTTIMYSLSLGFIIFIAVSFRLQINTFQYQELQKAGSRINLESESHGAMKKASVLKGLLDVCKTHKAVKDCAFMSWNLHDVTPIALRPELINLGRYNFQGQNIMAITPNYFEVTDRKFLKKSSWHKSGWEIDEQLYSVRGSYSMIIGSLYKDLLQLKLGSSMFIETKRKTDQFSIYKYYHQKPMAFLDAYPGGIMSNFPGAQFNIQDNLVSMPTFLNLSNGTLTAVDQIPLKRMFVKLKSTSSKDVNDLQSKFEAVVQGEPISVNDVNSAMEPLQIAATVMDFFFGFSTIIAMILCYFSLTSSMYTNIQEQAKEIGVLRAIGIRKFRLTRLYIYEGFVLVISASIMGIVIGFVISYTMSLQQILFTNMPLDFSFPWIITIIVFAMAFVCAFLATCSPIRRLLRLKVVTILRKQ